MRSKILVAAATAVSGLLIPSGFAATPDLAKTRTALEQWVEFRKLISEEQNDWRVEQETIRESIDLITSEIARIDNDLERLEAGATEADKERGRLNDDNEALKTAANAVSGVIAELEAKVTSLHARFPTDLKNKVQLLFVRIPKAGAATRASVGERLQNVVGILSEVEKFNRAITIVSEMQKMPSGETAQVRTIYLGLGVGYFTNEAGTYGGVLTPSPDGWTATENSAIAPAIRRAIGVYTNDVLAEFVPLPVEIK
ncbi:hypothetical protein ASA1KI_29210 [Opitutales bacterium ASA1]|uniref:DUF3450 family protein n=1 Tax=Congregicoccus parvus TaxID=3081749 RepID=UPI002B2EB489|nr:hypothetical protein ASA1KI_29210 [Opitutales bacterium ASA1]